MGKVIDSLTQQPMSFVNVYINGTTTGVRTDFNGEYAIEFNFNADSLTASFVGYTTVRKPIVLHKFQTINFALLENEISLKELVIHPTTNPAEILLKKVIENKKKNSGEDLQSYEYQAYSKIEFDANNISEKFKDSKMIKPFQFVFENIDTSTVNGKSYLPLFLTETLSDVYFRASPKSKKEIIKASRVSGVDNESIAQFLGDMYQDVDVYNNYVTIFDKNFVSPIANFGLAYYRYYLTDSTYFGKNWCYKIMFKPRRKQELTFTGYFWVADKSFAIKKFDMRIADDANINFINDLVTQQEFENINDSCWMVSVDKLIVDFNLVNNTKNNMGFYGTKTTSYKDYIFNKPKDDQFYNTPTNITVEEGASAKADTFWVAHRHDTLSKDEKAVYKMVDTLQTVKLFRTYVDVVKTIIMGYYVKGNIEWGPYFNIISFNDLEGARIRIGGRTSNDFSTKIMIDGHLAYGTKDQEFKYGGGFVYMLNKNPRRSIGAWYKYDIEQLGESQNSFITDNILASLLRRSPYDKLTMVKEFKSHYEHEWFNGFSNTIHFIHRDIYPLGITKFQFINGGQLDEMNSITTSEIQLDTRFAYNEKFVFGEFERTSMGTEYPVLTLKYAYGIKGFWNGDYEYTRAQLGVEHWFNIGSFGWSKYILEAGKIWGTLPYPLLKLHEGNETWVFDDYAFNMMNYYEFVSDQYVTGYYVHHFDGLFLNKIPLMRKLKWRETASVRAAFGELSPKNNQTTTFPSCMTKLDKPYFEVSAGVENIFKLIKINAVWRLSHLDHLKADGNKVNNFGILGTFQVYF
ncbi:MAG TPA: DUF5686 family protein [Bacteroidales bacterium]|mgnify:CR=1 FL=1|nr:DUF5686 family protein [Bacteroidales bacterium]HPS16103.1 DUF5686 family protein [Bacteroidales bacterium]